MTIGSLFSGIGGLELGLEMAGLGPTVWQAEQDPFCLDVLARHWPDAQRFKDVHEVTSASAGPVDLICGGFPCQDLSPAGRRAGIEHGKKSGLWREFLRIVADLRPRWVVVENTGHGVGGWMPAVRGDLGRIGYPSVCVRLRASDLGAWHERARGFIVANLDGVELRPIARGRHGVGARHLWARAVQLARAGAPWIAADGAGFGQHERQAQTGFAANTDGARQPQQGDIITDGRGWPGDGGETDAGRGRGTIKPCLARGVHGVPHRSHREKALGNAVVPAVAEAVGRFIMECEDV